MRESISTIQRSPRINTSYKFAAPCYRLPPMALQTVQVSVEPRLPTALEDFSVVPSSQRLSLCPSPLPRFQQRCLCTLRRDACERISDPLSKLFSKAEPLPFEKEININLVYSSCLKHANKMLLGDPPNGRLTSERKASPSRSSFITTRPCHSSAQAPSTLSLHALEHSTGSDSERVDT